MQNIYCKDTDLNFNLSFTVPDQYKNITGGLYTTVPKNTLDQKVTDLLKSIGLYVMLVDIAYIPPFSKGGTSNGVPIHTDGYPNKDHQCKLLWCISESPGYMNWYVPSVDDSQYQHKKTDSNTDYSMLDLADAKKVWTTTIANPSLINASIAHSVDNPSDQGQWFTSVALGDPDTNTFASWDIVCQRLAAYLK